MCQNIGILSSILFNLIFANSEFIIFENGTSSVAVGASAFYSGSYRNVSLATAEVLNWRLANKQVARFAINADGSISLFNLTTDARIIPSAVWNPPVYDLSLTILDLLQNDSGTVDIFRSQPMADVIADFIPLNVKVCDSNSIEDVPGIDVTGMGSHSYEYKFEVDCGSGFVGSVNLTCQADATWLQEGFCVEVTTTAEVTTAEGTTTGVKTRETGGMSEGDVAGTVLTCIFILECICLCVFVFALNYALSPNWLIGLYVAGICFSIIGIFMCFFGSSTAGTVMNSVEIAGTVLGSVGITVMLGGIVMQAWKGVGSKE